MSETAEHAPCAICGRAVERREDESLFNFQRRQYCCRRCQREGRSLSAVAAHAPRRAPQWPVVTDPGERLSGQCYARHEVRVRPERGRVARPATLVASSSVLGGDQ